MRDTSFGTSEGNLPEVTLPLKLQVFLYDLLWSKVVVDAVYGLTSRIGAGMACVARLKLATQVP